MKRFIIIGVVVAVLAIGLVTVLSVMGTQAQTPTSTATQVQTRASGQGKTEEVHITLSDHKVAMEKTTFETGVLYHFIIINKGMSVHELAVGPKGFGNDEEKLHAIVLGEVEDIDPGQTKTLDITFKEAAPMGQLEFLCAYPGHYSAGMALDIAVK
jgi:uncharacterized cupredoxin-like copper-binding protein